MQYSSSYADVTNRMQDKFHASYSSFVSIESRMIFWLGVPDPDFQLPLLAGGTENLTLIVFKNELLELFILQLKLN